MNYWILLLFSGAFVASTGLIYFLRGFAIKHGLFDEPGNNKIHTKAIPYLGGIGIWGAAAIALIAGVGFHLIPAPWVAGFILGGTVILLLGLWDDLKWKQSGRTFLKLVFQCLISLTTILFFIKLGINFQMVISPWLMIPFVTLYLVAVINALNVDDGLDGLAGGMAAMTLAGFLVLAFGAANWPVFIISGVLLCSVLGFLIYNWQPASIFMGDNGSLFLGFVLAIIAIIFTSHPFNFPHFIAPMLIIGFPIFDIACVIISRSIQGKSPFCKSRDYLYDKIHFKLGLSVRRTVLLCYLIQVVFVISGILLYQ